MSSWKLIHYRVGWLAFRRVSQEEIEALDSFDTLESGIGYIDYGLPFNGKIIRVRLFTMSVKPEIMVEFMGNDANALEVLSEIDSQLKPPVVDGGGEE